MEAEIRETKTVEANNRSVTRLKQAGIILAGYREDLPLIHEKISELENQLIDGRFYLAVVGQFKRGKSTILNALLGDKLLPTSVLPLTAIPTFISHGSNSKEKIIRVVFEDKKAVEHKVDEADEIKKLLDDLVTECGNPENRKAIARVEIEYQGDLLKNGIVLVDTPGIGSTFEHNTKTTLEFLPKCDAALFVVSADPPLTEAEFDFLSQVKDRASRIFFAFNKIDYLDREERREALAFLQELLVEKAGLDGSPEIFPLSARTALEAKRQGDQNKLHESGLVELEHRLVSFAHAEKMDVLRRAIERKALEVMEQALLQLRISLRSLQMPLADLEEKSGVFESKLAGIEKQRISLQDRLEGERRRCSEFIESQAQDLKSGSAKYLKETLEQVFSKDESRCPLEEELQNDFEKRVPDFFKAALKKHARTASNHVQSSLSEFQKEADRLVEGVRKIAAEIFDISYKAPESAKAFQLDTRVYWETHKWTPSFSPIPPGALDKLLPVRTRRQRLKKRWNEQVDMLVRQNVETVRWQLLQSTIKAFAHFSTQMEKCLAETVEATRKAMGKAHALKQEHSRQSEKEIRKLEETIDSVQTWLRNTGTAPVQDKKKKLGG
ncbi:MAG: Dynamin family protein [Deltaproteobacteria bacterium]|nr:Dynamin family protein [Deltaproteobacteria bacterium]